MITNITTMHNNNSTFTNTLLVFLLLRKLLVDELELFLTDERDLDLDFDLDPRPFLLLLEEFV